MGEDNTSVNIGKHLSSNNKSKRKNDKIILMGCPCHMVHNAAHYAIKAFERNINFNSEKLLVNLYFHFDYSLNRKNLLLVFRDSCNQDFYKILKFHIVRWLCLTTCIERTLSLYPSLKNYFLSQNLEIKDGEKAA